MEYIGYCIQGSTFYRVKRAAEKRAADDRAMDRVTVAARIRGRAARAPRRHSVGAKNAVAWLCCYANSNGEKMPMVERASGSLDTHTHYYALNIYNMYRPGPQQLSPVHAVTLSPHDGPRPRVRHQASK